MFDGMRWLSAYGVILAMGAISTALSVGITMLLFRLVGPRQTRFISQIVAAIIGAGFVIGVQAAAILYYGDFSRFALFQSQAIVDAAPGIDSPFWLPAKAAMGDINALLVMLAATGVLAPIFNVLTSEASLRSAMQGLVDAVLISLLVAGYLLFLRDGRLRAWFRGLGFWTELGLTSTIVLALPWE